MKEDIDRILRRSSELGRPLSIPARLVLIGRGWRVLFPERWLCKFRTGATSTGCA
jgi:hypothetical protein